jgi:hypothetical protein
VGGEQLPVLQIVPTSWQTPANCTGKANRRLSTFAVTLWPEKHPATLNVKSRQTANQNLIKT